MHRLAGLLVALALCQANAESWEATYHNQLKNDGTSTGATSRIVSGWPALPGQHPHQTSLRIINAWGVVQGCGGSVVHRRWVISAAHCTAGQVTAVVRAGLTSLLRPEYIFETTEWYNHPSFDETDASTVQPNDISILRLQRPVTYTANLQPIRVQSRADAFRNYESDVLVASGFGLTWTNGLQSEDLLWVYLRGVANANCRMLFGSNLINDAAICAGFYNVTSQSTCQGDSGGPLVHYAEDGSAELIGVASFVAGGDFGCHSGIPAGFVRPGPFLDWFEEVSGIDFENFEDEVDPEEQEVTTLAPSTEAPDTDTEEVDEDDSDSESDEDDPELAEILKKLIVKVKVKVKINNKVKRKIKIKCVDHI